MKRKKNWCTMDIYYVKVPTFRRTLELRIGWDEEDYNKLFSWTQFENLYETTTWIYVLFEDYNCNIIWLKKYDLSALVHELVHCVEWMADQVWLEMKWEPIAYIYEELFTKIWHQCWDRFRLDKAVEKFFFED